MASRRALVATVTLVLTVPSFANQSTSQAPRIVRVFEDGRFIQVLYGDPDREGGHYAIRIGNDDGQIVFPHRHPEDEHIVVIQGTWFLGHGESCTISPGRIVRKCLVANARPDPDFRYFSKRIASLSGGNSNDTTTDQGR